MAAATVCCGKPNIKSILNSSNPAPRDRRRRPPRFVSLVNPSKSLQIAIVERLGAEGDATNTGGGVVFDGTNGLDGPRVCLHGHIHAVG